MTSTTFWIQFTGVIFGTLMMYFTFVKYKRQEINNSEFVVWNIGWATLIFVAIIPSILDLIIAPLNFYRRLDFFVIFGFFILLGLGFYNYTTTRRLQRKLETFVRREALQRQRDSEKLVSKNK